MCLCPKYFDFHPGKPQIIQQITNFQIIMCENLLIIMTSEQFLYVDRSKKKPKSPSMILKKDRLNFWLKQPKLAEYDRMSQNWIAFNISTS